MARPFSAALFLAAFRSNFYAEFWDGASPLSPFPPIPGQRPLLVLSMLLLGIIYHWHTQLIANRYRACAPVEMGSRTARCGLPDAGRTHPRMSPR